MKLLLIHYRYFISGGPERYLFNLKDLLEKNGHKIIPFSIQYTQNENSEFSNYFVSPLSNTNEVFFREQTWTFKSFIKTLERNFYSPEVYKNLEKLINDTKPDCALVLQFGRKLSPAVLNALDNLNIPFVVRVSDFGYICANSHFLRKQKTCELCIKGDKFYSVWYKCVQNSFGASLVNFLANKLHQLMRYFEKVRYYIVPSKFTITKMIEAGFSPKKLIHIPTFIDIEEIKKNEISRKRQIIYIGRIDNTKGLHILLEAVKLLYEENVREFQCVIAGSGQIEYLKQIRDYIKKNGIRNVHLTGYLEKRKIFELLQESLFSICPSLSYDNMPNSMLESLAVGTPVIASNHGSFLEVINNKTGLLFKPGDPNDLSIKIKYLFNNPKLITDMSKNAKIYIKENHSPKIHYENLMQLFDNLRKERANI
jgi:glycosyltransferase involved in cell wall biosynthesis